MVSLPPPCTQVIAQRYELPVQLVVAVRQVESSGNANVGKVCRNNDGSCDIGVMQINTFWLPTLKQSGINANLLANDECTNIAVGSWILATNLYRYGNLRAALSAYNTGKPASNVGLRYADKVISTMKLR